MLPSPSEKTPKSGAEDSHERHGSSVVGVNMDKCDPGEIKKIKEKLLVRSSHGRVSR